jgi:glucoamylase
LAAFRQTNLDGLGFYMLLLMLRNVTTAGFVVEDPMPPHSYSLPGCVIAAPSFPANTPGVDQDYVFNWVRDAAITMIEIAEAKLPAIAGGVDTLGDYVSFARLCYDNAQPSKGHACFTVSGQSRQWTEQSDGPALQTLALLRAYDQLDAASKTAAIDLIGKNLDYLLAVYKLATTNLWEEHDGFSFFARSVQLRCFREIAANPIGIAIPTGLQAAIGWLETALTEHWNGMLYVSLMVPGSNPPQSVAAGYDANIDIVCACVYGAIACTDTKLLATAAVLRRQWDDPASQTVYPINLADQALQVGPLLGRYPGDAYDGDVSHPVPGGHPWALCTANFAELHYMLAKEIETTGKLPFDPFSTTFFGQLAISATTTAEDAAAALRDAGDAMLRAIIYHSDRYELSEQFDANSGYEKSVRNLTWSYAAFLSALRARAA